MKSPDLSRGGFIGLPVMESITSTAHSGPELVRSVPHARLAHELAKALLTDHFQVTQQTTHSIASGSFSSGMRIRMARR